MPEKKINPPHKKYTVSHTQPAQACTELGASQPQFVFTIHLLLKLVFGSEKKLNKVWQKQIEIDFGIGVEHSFCCCCLVRSKLSGEILKKKKLKVGSKYCSLPKSSS